VWIHSIDLTLLGEVGATGYCCIGSIYKIREVIAKFFFEIR
jgi:hypothetical protein